MKAQDRTVLSLDLAPRLKRPLTLWNPLDYLRLLYWAFFFPQAIPWYINIFGKAGYPDKEKINTIAVLRHDPVQRKLVIQALIVLLITVSIAALGLTLPGWKVNWEIFVAGATLGVISGVIVGKVLGVAFGVPFGLTFGLTFGLMGNIIEIAFHSTFNQNNISDLGAVLGTALGAAVGVAVNAAGSVKSGVDDDVVKGITGGMFFIVVGGIFFAAASVLQSITASATANILSKNLKNTSFFSIGLGAAFCLFFSRLIEYFPLGLFTALYRYIFKKRKIAKAGRVVFLPLPGVRKQLEKELESDWEKGIHNANQILSYNLQYIPVVKAVKNILKRSQRTQEDTLLSRVSVLVDLTWDWNLIRFCSATLNKQFLQKAKEGFLFLFIRKKNDLVKLPIDTPARAACAGFWYWHQEKPVEAVEAFAIVQELHHGTELYYIASAIDKWFEINSSDEYKNKVEGIAKWEKNTRRLKSLPTPELRPGTLEILRNMQTVSQDVRLADEALSSFKRAKIAETALAKLKRLLEKDENHCLQPEWGIIKVIINKWIYLIERKGWKFGEEELRQEVINPYEGSSGLPVTGPTFRGREGIIEKIEEHWATDKNFPTLILYGQRRIGKTSILKNMVQRTESDIIVVYISMQKVASTGQFLYLLAKAIQKDSNKIKLQMDGTPIKTDYTGMETGCDAFNRLLDKLAPHMTGQKRLVLAIDEFESIQEKIEEKKIDADILPYLRDIVQEYNWLGIIFGGLHKLKEMGRDYKAAFFGQADDIRVSFLEKKDAFDLIAHPKPPRFALEYSKELLEKLYRYTGGHPYLIQCLCRELVTRWNEIFKQEGEKTHRILTLDDLPPVITPDFYKRADDYFDAVWKSVTENERILMSIIAKHQEGNWTLDELVEAVKTHPSLKNPGTFKKTLELLERHDVTVEEAGNVHFAAELMRRWVAEKKS